MEKKIIAFEKAQEQIEALRNTKKNTTVVLCHGCFDIVHPGHIRHLKFAREQGTFLVVSITPDVCVQKGSSRPYVPQELRAENLAAIECVNMVVVAPGETGTEPIEVIKPDIYVKGGEYAVSRDSRFLKEKNLVEKLGGRVVYSSGEVIFSSTELIRDHDLNTAESEKLQFICKRYDIKKSILTKILEEAPKRKFLIVGESLLDEYKYCDGLGIAQESPVLSISLKHRVQFVGGAGTLALHLAALGANVTFLSSVDMNSEGSGYFHYTLNESGISLSNIEDKHRPIIVRSHYFVDFHQVLELENGRHRPLDSSLRSQILKQFKKELKNSPDCVVLSDFGYGLLPEDLVADMIATAQAKGIPLASDISMTLRTQLEKFYESDYFNATEMELRSCMHDYESGISVLVDRFYSQSSVKELYLTLADGSALYFRRPPKKGVENMESAHIPSLLLRRGDKRGCGEAFLAGTLLSKAGGGNEVQSMYLGTILAAVHSRSIGNKPLKRDEVIRLLEERRELAP
ncbi:MAG: hypothetical protein A2X49_00735 [Lentisphaerae bacterium GWF2_52_8]|nr:MAG: hypothetical protein A2X49_00735 [Lentisphaerae bacterium GWF2_52_8]